MSSTSQQQPPSSILIIGSGVFGLATLHEFLLRPEYSSTQFTLLSESLPSSSDLFSPLPPSGLQWQTTPLTYSGIASHDTTRIVRSDYSDPVYLALAREARARWRGDWGADERYTESGLLLTADSGTSGAKYVASVLSTVKDDAETAKAVKETPSRDAITAEMRAPGAAIATGDSGYLNAQSGWANASKTMSWLLLQIQALSTKTTPNRVTFISGTASRLLTSSTNPTHITGAQLTSGAQHTADLTILATGAWTPSLIDLHGIASARGQCMAYVAISPSEADTLKNMPVHMNLSNGCFIFPPTSTRSDTGDEEWELKVARHAFGYTSPVSTPAPVDVDASSTYTTSLPSLARGLPRPDARLLKSFVENCIPLIAPLEKITASRPHGRGMKPRKCFYLDTASGDYLVCMHPRLSGLFLATGGSGHAFKFAPALGAKVVDVLGLVGGWGGKEGGEVEMFARKWAWPERSETDEVWCMDGSRAGEKGLVLDEAFEIP